jgi:hypothetical protein
MLQLNDLIKSNENQPKEVNNDFKDKVNELEIQVQKYIKEKNESNSKIKQQEEMLGRFNKIEAEKRKMEDFYKKELDKTKSQCITKVNMQNKELSQ